VGAVDVAVADDNVVDATDDAIDDRTEVDVDNIVDNEVDGVASEVGVGLLILRMPALGDVRGLYNVRLKKGTTNLGKKIYGPN